MSTISVQEIQRDPQELLDRLAAGEVLVLLDGHRVVGEVRPMVARPGKERSWGLSLGEFTVPDDFDAPLSEIF